MKSLKMINKEPSLHEEQVEGRKPVLGAFFLGAQGKKRRRTRFVNEREEVENAVPIGQLKGELGEARATIQWLAPSLGHPQKARKAHRLFASERRSLRGEGWKRSKAQSLTIETILEENGLLFFMRQRGRGENYIPTHGESILFSRHQRASQRICAVHKEKGQEPRFRRRKNKITAKSDGSKDTK